MLRFLSLLAVLGATLSYTAFAEDTPAMPDIPKPLKVMPSKIKPVQSGEDELSKAAPETIKSESSTDNNQLESLSPRAMDSFQGDFSGEFTRAEINKFFSKESKVSSSYAARKLALKLALTPFLGMLDDAKYPENIYGLRLNQFLNLGSWPLMIHKLYSIYQMQKQFRSQLFQIRNQYHQLLKIYLQFLASLNIRN